MSDFTAIKRITHLEGTLSCVAPCEEEAEFSIEFDPPTDGEEVEELVLDLLGWGETGLCPKCERQHAAEEAADRARYERKAGMDLIIT